MLSNPSENLRIESRGDATIVQFNRPEIRSPLSILVLDEVEEILDATDRATRMIFTGVGDTFASGADLREIAEVTGETAADFARRGQRLMAKIAVRPDTTAAINGYCFGGALDLALSCKRRIASPTAEFCHPGVGLGIMTGWGGTQRLPRLIGEAAALEMFLTARRVSAHDALRIGLIDSLADDPITALFPG